MPQPPAPPAAQRAQSATPPPARSGPRLFFPAVDGLRGVAILSVLLYHTSWFSNGLLGVDAFMVLSGFLITLLLLREATTTGRVRLGGFYRRRFKRLMPGLSITLLATVALTYVLGGLKEAQQVGEKAIASLLQVANWQQIVNSDAYWEGFGRINPLAHMWSLSITEQFYLVWPFVFLLVFWLCRRSVPAVTIVMAALLLATAAIAPVMYDGTNTDRIYLGTETRAVDFVAGATGAGVVMLLHRRAAVRRHARPSRIATVLATVIGLLALGALVTISVLVSSYHEPWLYEGGMAAVAVVTGVLIIALCHERGPLVRALSFGPLAEIGRISYTMYLLHLPIFWLMQKGMPTIAPYALFLVGGLLTWLASMVMHYALTERIRLRSWRPASAIPTAVTLTVGITAGAYYLPDAVEKRMNPAGRPSIVLLGDSLSADFAEALASDGRDRFAVVDGSISGCGVVESDATRPVSGKVWPASKQCRIRETLWRESLRKTRPEAVVAHFGWDAADQQINGVWLTPCQPAYRQHYLTKLDVAVQQIRTEVSDVPIFFMNEYMGTWAASRQSIGCYNKIMVTYAASGKIRLLDYNQMLCAKKGQCRKTDDEGKPLFVDGVHFTPQGRRFIAPILEDHIAEALATSSHKPAG